MREKEKLVKIHYKGFDFKVKCASFAALGAFVLSLGVFLPLTYHTEVAAQKAKEDLVQQEAKNNGDGSSESKGAIILDF